MVDNQEIDAILQKVKPIELTEEKPNLLQKIGLQKGKYIIANKPFPYGIFLKIQLEYSKLKNCNANTIKGLADSVLENAEIVNRILCFGFGEDPDTIKGKVLLKHVERNLPHTEVYNTLTFIFKQAHPGNFTIATNLAHLSLVAEKSEATQK